MTAFRTINNETAQAAANELYHTIAFEISAWQVKHKKATAGVKLSVIASVLSTSAGFALGAAERMGLPMVPMSDIEGMVLAALKNGYELGKKAGGDDV